MTQDKSKTILRQQIDENLRKVYEQVVKEDVPDRFQDLLRRLKDKDANA